MGKQWSFRLVELHLGCNYAIGSEDAQKGAPIEWAEAGLVVDESSAPWEPYVGSEGSKALGIPPHGLLPEM